MVGAYVAKKPSVGTKYVFKKKKKKKSGRYFFAFGNSTLAEVSVSYFAFNIYFINFRDLQTDENILTQHRS